MDANQQQDVRMLIPSCVAAVDVLINGQALSTQAQRSALDIFRDMSAYCPATSKAINYVFARAGRALFQLLSSSDAHTLSYL